MNNKKKLKKKCKLIKNKTIKNLLDLNGIKITDINIKNKGIFGNLIEKYLNLKKNNKKQLDLNKLNLEIKTIPLNNKNYPKESTFICSIPQKINNIIWEKSWLLKKISNILWIPYQGDKNISFLSKKIYTPFLWKPSKKDKKYLKQDWKNLIKIIYMGGIDELNSSIGLYLHVKSKSSNNKKLINYVYNNHLLKTTQKGFYFTKKFTKKIINNELKIYTKNQIKETD